MGAAEQGVEADKGPLNFGALQLNASVRQTIREPNRSAGAQEGRSRV